MCTYLARLTYSYFLGVDVGSKCRLCNWCRSYYYCSHDVPPKQVTLTEDYLQKILMLITILRSDLYGGRKICKKNGIIITSIKVYSTLNTCICWWIIRVNKKLSGNLRGPGSRPISFGRMILVLLIIICVCW